MNTNEIALKVIEIVDKANKTFGMNMAYPDITFFSKTVKAGYAYKFKNLIAFNTVLARENSKEFEHTIAHEIAHKITWALFPNAKQNHGPEFKSVMRRLGYDRENLTYHSYDVTNVKKRVVKKEYEYTCGCRSIMLTSIRHNRAQSGTIYRCNMCMNVIRLK